MDNTGSELEVLEHILIDANAEPIRLSYALLRSITDNFSNEIGRDGFGVVYMGTLRNGKVAVKMICNEHDVSDKLFLDEIQCLIREKHKNIVRFLGYCSDMQVELMEFNGTYVMAEAQKRLLCFEYVPNGNLEHYLKEKPHGDDWSARYQMIRGICHGLHCLHDNQINHLDLKPENVMLDAQMQPKITDFGLSRLLYEGQSKIFTQLIVGAQRYIAPEIIDKEEISFKSDIFALGIIIIKLLTGIRMISLENNMMLTAAQWAARRRQQGGGFDHDDGGSSTASSGGGKRRGRCYNCGQRGHFRRDCTKPKKAEEAEKALLADVDDVGPTLL